MGVQKTTIDCGFVTIHLPDASQNKYYIFQDLASSLGVEENYIAEKIIKKYLKLNIPDAKVTFDSEADNCAIYTSKAESMVGVLKAIKALAVSHYITEAAVDEATQAMASWVKPKPQRWREGDIFTILLEDGESKAYGQVLIRDSRYSAICALFNKMYHGNDPDLTDNILSIVQINASRLNTFEWEVIDNKDVAITINLHPNITNHFYSSHMFNKLANAYFGITEWQDYYGDMLWRQNNNR